MLLGAIDIGGTKTMVGVCNEKGEILAMEKFPTVSKKWEEHFDLIAVRFRNALEEIGIHSLDDLKGIGINCPGMVDPFGKLIYAPHQNWRNVPVKEYFAAKLQIDHIIVENDVNACALGEMIFGGAGRDFLWITISTGNGGAIVANGKLVRGANSCAGEFGHLKVEYNLPRRCSCGQFGCLEAYSSGTAIKEILAEEQEYNLTFRGQLSERKNMDNEFIADAHGLSLLAREGNETAIKLFQQSGRYLGRAISYGLNISNPESVYLGGGMAESLDLMMPSIREELKKCAIEGTRGVDIRKSNLGYQAAFLGAAALVY